MLPARGEYVKLGKGSLLLDLLGPDGNPLGLNFMGNASSVEFGSEPTQVELYSSTQASAGLVAKDVVRTAYTLTVSLNEYTLQNLELFLLGDQVTRTQAQATQQSKNIDGAVPGGYYELDARRVADVIVMAGTTELVAGTDYDINSEHGSLYVRPGSEIVTAATNLTVLFAAPELTVDQIRLGTVGTHTGRVLFLGNDVNQTRRPSRDRLELWKVDIAPNGALQLIGEDYGSFTLAMGVLSDEAHPDSPYGILERVRQ